MKRTCQVKTMTTRSCDDFGIQADTPDYSQCCLLDVTYDGMGVGKTVPLHAPNACDFETPFAPQPRRQSCFCGVHISQTSGSSFSITLRYDSLPFLRFTLLSSSFCCRRMPGSAVRDKQ
jgi:hypothetical protein